MKGIVTQGLEVQGDTCMHNFDQMSSPSYACLAHHRHAQLLLSSINLSNSDANAQDALMGGASALHRPGKDG